LGQSGRFDNTGRNYSDEVSQLTSGLIANPVSVSLNKLLAPGVYYTVLIFGATVPHEVGFAGGAKYFFPGVAGPELTHMTHWLAHSQELRTSSAGDTPTRRLIEAASDFVPAELFHLTRLCRDQGRLVTYALFGGEVREAFRRAADVTSGSHSLYRSEAGAWLRSLIRITTNFGLAGRSYKLERSLKRVAS
jgi:nickel-dependent lactate racemase